MAKTRTENQFTHSISASNVDEKWSKNHGDLMHPGKVIALLSSGKDINIFICSNSVRMHQISIVLEPFLDRCCMPPLKFVLSLQSVCSVSDLKAY